MKKTKNITLLISGVGCGVFLTLLFLVLNDSCGLYSSLCKDTYTLSASFLFLFPFIFIFSLITYFLRDEIFHAWLKFTYVWAPLSMFLVLITPGDTGGGFMPSLIDKQMTAILMSGLFVIISLLIIVVKLVKPYWNK